MNFYQTLQDKTANERAELLMAPVITRCRHHNISIEEYIYFLTQAYHHVKHTVPLLKSCKQHIPMQYEWIKQALDEYIVEENGHEIWILNDIEACGGDRSGVVNSLPCRDIQEMIKFLYNQIENNHPLALFGMVQVLEGVSVSVACEMAALIQQSLGLSANTVTYLQSHGALDVEHLKFFEGLMNKMTDTNAQQEIINSAIHIYKYYTGMLLSVNAINRAQA